MNGNRKATHVVAHQHEQLLTEEEFIAYEDFSFEDMTWVHTNTWEYPYYLKASTIDVSQIVVRQGEWYIRCIRPVFKSLKCRCPLSPFRDWEPLGGPYWGFPNIMEEQGGYTYSRLFFQQGIYDNEQDAIRDMNDKSKIDLSIVCDEIFGNG